MASAERRWRQLYCQAENGLLVLLLSGMVALAGLQIILRNGFDSGLSWADPALRLLVLWLALAGAIVATRDDQHIRIDVLARFVSPRMQAALRLATELFSAAICALLAYHGGRFVLLDWEAGVLAFGVLPAWLGELIIPLGFSLMTLRFAAAARRALHDLRKPSK